MTEGLYGPHGFFITRAPAEHFRTSAHASPQFAAALLRLLHAVDAALGHPHRLDVVDVGAGRAELLHTLAQIAPAELVSRLRMTAVELAPRPSHLAPDIDWQDRIPVGITGLLLATEWLDNVPVDVAEATADGWRRVLVDPETGAESVGGPVDPAEARWLDQWWPYAPGGRAEIGITRDAAWAEAVRAVRAGVALAIDYGHLRHERPYAGSLTGYRAGRQVPPRPDGSTDITAHVALDSLAAAGMAAAGLPYQLLTQRDALGALGADGARPPLALASTDPLGYVRALAAASAVAELRDPVGLGGHWWLLQPVDITTVSLVAR